MSLDHAKEQIAAGRSALPDPVAADIHLEAAWETIREAERSGAPMMEVVQTWMDLARFIVGEWAPIARTHGTRILDDEMRRAWYRRLGDTLRTVFFSYRALHGAGYLTRDIDEAIGPTCALLLEEIDTLARGTALA